MSAVMITEEMLAALRKDVGTRLSEYRMAHTLGVEAMAVELAALYCPEKTMLLRAAALLHDVTKELSDEEQLRILLDHGVTLRQDERDCPQIWHAITAPRAIAERYAPFALAEVIAAVRWHATGRAEMTLTEALVYLADYIERGRTHGDCVAVRDAFFGAEPQSMPQTARNKHLRDVMLQSYEKTVGKLQGRGQGVCTDTLDAMAYLKQRTEI